MAHPSVLQPGASRHRVVVVGGGFGGIRAAQGLRDEPVDVTLVDRRNFHLFQPLTYQVATGALAPGEVAYPLRALFKSALNVRVLMAAVEGFDLDAHEVHLAADPRVGETPPLQYDTLIVAAGSSYSYFGHDEWSRVAPEVKSLESAVTVRSRILAAFERAELETDPALRAADLTFIDVGGGPTGEMARDTMRRDFRSIDPRSARILLVEGVDRLLGTFPPSLSAKAQRSLEQLGVTPTLNRFVVGVDEQGVELKAPDGSVERVPARTVIWAAGVRASPLATALAEAVGVQVDRTGRLTVEPDLSLPGHPEVLALGDMVQVRGTNPLPGVAPVAIQQGHYAAKLISNRLMGRPTGRFSYRDKGNLATIGRGHAVADLGFVRLSGVTAWLTWLVVHLWYLIGFQNRLLVFLRWVFSFVSHGRGARIIAESEHVA
jgi:NADH dehydrogenase